MNIRSLINTGAEKLKTVAESPRLDANILLAHILKMDRARLLAEYDFEPTENEIKQYLALIEKRVEGFPVSYLLNEKEFYGHTFYVEDGVLTPRPDTEVLVEKAIKLIGRYQLKTVLDMCTGTGCIAITIKLESPETEVSAADISPISQKVFTKNNNSLTKGSVKFIETDLFTKLKDQKFDIITTNPPYLTKNETIERVNDGWKEPTLALDGGEDGLDLIRTIIKEAPTYLNCGGWLLIEADPKQMETMKFLLKDRGFSSIEVFQDLPGFDRIIVGRYE